MKKTFFVLILLTFFRPLRGQTLDGFYKPNGDSITGEFSTIKSILTYLGSDNNDIKVFNDNESAYFKRLSNIPVLIMLENGTKFKTRQYYIDKYNYKKYLNSYSFYYDLQDMIKEKKLTKDYLIDVFGKPTRVENFDNQDILTFAYNNCKVNADSDGKVFFADVHNYLFCSQVGLSIEGFNATGGEYSIGFDIVIENYSRKTIKYVSFVVKALNDVNDIVSNKTVKGVGPIKYGDVGSYEFNDLIFSRSATHIKISAIKLQYMDGSFKNITLDQINKIIKIDWEKEGQKTLN